MTEWIIASTLGFGAGGAFVWFAKDTINKWVLGGATLAAMLEDKASKIRKAL